MADVSTLADYLRSMRGRKWQPGVLDCGVFMADWAALVCGRDPIADVRGSYSTEKQFMRIVDREGGFERACAKRLSAVGFREVGTSANGDIAVVMAPARVGGRYQLFATGSICVNENMRAVVTSDKGLVITPLPTIRAWSFDG